MGGRIFRVLGLTPPMFVALGSLHGLDVRLQEPAKPEPVIERMVAPVCSFENATFEKTKDGVTLTTAGMSVVNIDYTQWAGSSTPFLALSGFFNVFPKAPYERFFVPDRMNSSVARYDVSGYAQLVLSKWPNGWVLDTYATCPSTREWT